MAMQKKSVTRGLTQKSRTKTPNRVAKKAKAVKVGPGTSLLTAFKSAYKY